MTRINKRNTGTYDTIINKIKKVQKHGFNTGAIVVLTKYNNHYPKAIYNLFKENKIHMKIGRLVNSGRAKLNKGKISLLPREYGKFAIELFELWFNDKENTIGISPFDSILHSIIYSDKKHAECIFTGDCHKKFIGISPNGNIYPCGLYDGYEEFSYGNIHEIEIDKIDEIYAYKILEHRQKVIKQLCGKCEFINYCHGGCPFSALSNNGNILSNDYYCEAYKMIFGHIVEKVNKELENIDDSNNKIKKLICGGGGGGDGGKSLPKILHLDYGDYDDWDKWGEYPDYIDYA